MDQTFTEVIDKNLSISLKSISVIDVKKSFTIANFYDIDNTIIFPIYGNFRYGKYKKKLEKDAVLFIPAHNTISLSFGSKRSQTLAYEDFIDNKSKFISEDNLISNRPKVDKYLIINLDVKAYDLVNIFHTKNLDVYNLYNKELSVLFKKIIHELKTKLVGSSKVIQLVTDQLVYEIIRSILSKQPLFSGIEENFKFFNDEKILDLF